MHSESVAKLINREKTQNYLFEVVHLNFEKCRPSGSTFRWFNRTEIFCHFEKSATECNAIC